MTPTPEFKILNMEALISAIKIDLYGAIDRVLLEQSHFIVASDFNDPINQILIDIEKMHYSDCPDEAFIATVSPDNVSVFFLNRNQISDMELAMHLCMTPAEFEEHAPSGFVFIASGEYRERFQEYFEDEQIVEIPRNSSAKTVH